MADALKTTVGVMAKIVAERHGARVERWSAKEELSGMRMSFELRRLDADLRLVRRARQDAGPGRMVAHGLRRTRGRPRRAWRPGLRRRTMRMA